jgi:hypothetical protein
MKVRSPGQMISLWVALLLTAIAASGNAADELHVYGIANFGGKGQCASSEMTHSVHTETASSFALWFNVLRQAGKWDDVRTRNNSSARGTYFTDSGKVATGQDSTTNFGADEADVIYIHTHGGHSATGAGHSSLSMGNSSYICTVQTNSHMLWNSDLDIAVVKACQSGDYGVWSSGGYDSFLNSKSPLSMWNAFHGDSSCGGHVTSYVFWYAITSTYNGVGENWLEAAYDREEGSNNDDCPVSIVFGETSAKRLSMFENGGWKDRKDTGKKTGSTYFYYEGCNPDNGSKLPN